MLKLTEYIAREQSDNLAEIGTLTLAFEQRQKSRLRTALDDGREAGFILPRGTVLRGGDCLRADDGTVVRVMAAAEAVSTAFHRDAQTLARACYHLGNRHVALQIDHSWVRYRHDHVLDAMLESLGLRVYFEHAAFEPENGAYAHTHATHGGAATHGHHTAQTPDAIEVGTSEIDTSAIDTSEIDTGEAADRHDHHDHAHDHPHAH